MPVLSRPRASGATPIRLLVATLAALLAWFAASSAWAADASLSLSPARLQVPAGLANSPPSSPVIWANPAMPTTGQVVIFTGSATDPDAGDWLTYSWSIDGVSSGGPTTTRTFARAGTFPVSLTVSDASGATAGATGSITVTNPPPTGNFTWSPSVPRTGQALKLTASGSDPNGTITNMEWDLDGNGSYADVVDEVGRSTTVSFNTPGQHVVNLRITDDGGSTTVVTRKIPVVAPPAAGFTWSPVTPTVGQAVTFTSTSSDPDGTVVATNWNLDGKGKFDDGRGISVQRAFSAPGTYEISVRATDNTGLTDVATQRITVALSAPNPGPVQNTSPTAKPPRTALNAIVRLSGMITSRGARITRLTVKGPAGASVTGRCRGRGCPRAPKPLLITAKKPTVHLRRLERTLRAGVRITVMVTQSGRIGKYTRFIIRRSKSPARKDMCVNGRAITKCPP
jgi:plastocyanin